MTEEYRINHVLFIIDLVRNVEQCFHMADLQEGRRGRGEGASTVLCLIGAVQLHWLAENGGRCGADRQNKESER